MVKPWTYESWDERQRRDSEEFTTLADNAAQALVDPDPMRIASASQAFTARENRYRNAESNAALRQRVSARVQERMQERKERDISPLGILKTVGSGAIEGLERVRHAGIGFFTADNPIESVEQVVGGLRGERYSGEDLGFIRHLPEGSRGRSVAGRVGEEFTDPVNYLIALKGPVLAAKITGKGVASRAARAMIEPVVTGPAALRLGSEAGVSAVARIAGEQAIDALPEDAPAALQVGVGLGAGLLGGSAASVGIGAGVRAGRAASQRVEGAALESALREEAGYEPRSVTERVRERLAANAARRSTAPVAGGAMIPGVGRVANPTDEHLQLLIDEAKSLGVPEADIPSVYAMKSRPGERVALESRIVDAYGIRDAEGTPITPGRRTSPNPFARDVVGRPQDPAASANPAVRAAEKEGAEEGLRIMLDRAGVPRDIDDAGLIAVARERGIAQAAGGDLSDYYGRQFPNDSKPRRERRLKEFEDLLATGTRLTPAQRDDIIRLLAVQHRRAAGVENVRPEPNLEVKRSTEAIKEHGSSLTRAVLDPSERNIDDLAASIERRMPRREYDMEIRPLGAERGREELRRRARQLIESVRTADEQRPGEIEPLVSARREAERQASTAAREARLREQYDRFHAVSDEYVETLGPVERMPYEERAAVDTMGQFGLYDSFNDIPRSGMARTVLGDVEPNFLVQQWATADRSVLFTPLSRGTRNTKGQTFDEAATAFRERAMSRAAEDVEREFTSKVRDYAETPVKGIRYEATTLWRDHGAILRQIAEEAGIRVPTRNDPRSWMAFFKKIQASPRFPQVVESIRRQRLAETEDLIARMRRTNEWARQRFFGDAAPVRAEEPTADIEQPAPEPIRAEAEPQAAAEAPAPQTAVVNAPVAIDAPIVRGDAPEVAEALEAAGFENVDGRLIGGGDLEVQARQMLPDDSPIITVRDNAPEGSTYSSIPPWAPPRASGGRSGGGGGAPGGGAPGGVGGGALPPAGGSGGGGVPAGGREPKRGTAGIDQAVADTDAGMRQPGAIDRMVRSAVARVPGGPAARRFVMAALNPIANHTRRIMVAYNAEANAFSMLKSRWQPAEVAALRAVEAAYDAAVPRYVGPADRLLSGTLADVLENPRYYDRSPELVAAMRVMRDTQEQIIREAREAWNVDILPFEYADPDAVYIPHVRARASADEAFTQTGERLVASGRRKHREHETLNDRITAHAERIRSGAEKPPPGVDPTTLKGLREIYELDVDRLAMHHTEALARMAAQETFIKGSGGMTRAEIIESLRPGITQKKAGVARQVENLQARMRTAMADGRIAARDTRREAGRMTRVERRAQPILERLESLGYATKTPEYGVELSYLAGQARELGYQWRHLRAELLKSGAKVEEIAARHAGFEREYQRLTGMLESIAREYDRPIPPEYAMSNRTLRYYPAEEARAIDSLYRTSKDIPGIGRMQTGMEHWRGMAVAADATFATIHGAFAALMDPGTTFRVAGKSAEAARNPGLMLRIAQAEPEWVQRFSFYSGFPWDIAGGRESLGGELARGRGLEAIRYKGIGERVQAFNDAQWRAVQVRLFEQFKLDAEALIEAGYPAQAAYMEAAELLHQIVPRMNPRRSGRSQAHAEIERMLTISPSFLFQPAVMLKDMASGLVKLGAQKAGAHGEGWAMLLPRERLAIRRYGTMAATIAGISATSALLSSPFTNQNPAEAVAEVMNPMSGKFMSLVVGNQGSIGLGSAHRTAIRALFPRVNADGEIEPLGGFEQMLRGKRHPALAQALDQFAGEDFGGNLIEEGRLPFATANRLWYAAEGALPIWMQPFSAAGRGAETAPDSFAEGMLQAAFGTLGYSYYERSPFDQLDALARGRHGVDYHSLAPSQQVEIREEYPDLWAKSVKQGREQRRQYQAYLDVARAYQQESDTMLASGEITREAWLNNYRQRQQQLAGYREAIFANSPQGKRGDDPLDLYFEQIEASRGADGVPQWELVDAWKAGLTPEQQDYIDANTGVTNSLIGRVYRDVSRTYGEYLERPKYRGYSGAEAREIDAAWQIVRNVANEMAGGEEPDRRTMLAAMGRVRANLPTEARIRSGVTKRILGQLQQTQDRSRFRAQHPEIDLFYGRGPLTDRQVGMLMDLAEAKRRPNEAPIAIR